MIHTTSRIRQFGQSGAGGFSSMTYAAVLRAVGQDLEIRDIKALDLSVDADILIAKCSYQSPPAPMPVTLHYTLEDVERLDEEAREKRKSSDPPGEFLSLSHVLRAIGGYVDRINGRLLRISNNESNGTDPVFRVEYETAAGERVIDDRSGAAIYDICVNMYKQRGKQAERFQRYARWRR